MNPSFIDLRMSAARRALFIGEQQVADVEETLGKLETHLAELRKVYYDLVAKNEHSQPTELLLRYANGIQRAESTLEETKRWAKALASEVDKFRRLQDSESNTTA